MKKTCIILTICVLTCITVCGQSTTEYSNTYEKHIMVILDTLKNDYYWQSIPSDLLGHVPPNFDFEAEAKKYPFRIDRNNYLRKLDSLMDKNLSENLLINLLNRKYKAQQNFYFNSVLEKLFTYQTDRVYEALYIFLIKNPEQHKIVKELIKNERYKPKVQYLIREASKRQDFAKHLKNYFHIFDKETDKELVNKFAQHLIKKLDTETFYSFLNVGAIQMYYNMDDDAVENEQIKTYRKKMTKLDNGKEFEEARNNYWRAWTQSVLKYHKEKNKL